MGFIWGSCGEAQPVFQATFFSTWSSQAPAEVMAPPKCRASTGSRLGVLNIRWGFRKIFETNVREALEQHSKSRKEAKRARKDSLSERPTKRAKLDLGHRRRSNPSEDGRASTSSKFSKCSGASKTKKTLQVRIGK